MAREPKCRRVESTPKVTEFKPVGIPRSKLEDVILKVEELEAIRLKDLLSMEQEECAVRMGVSRPTFQRILNEGRHKIAIALIEGKAIRVEGGDYCLGQWQCRKANRFRRGADCPYREAFVDNPDDTVLKAGSRIAVCTNDDSISAQIDGLFRHCAFFMIWDEKENNFKAVRNNGAHLTHLAGNEAAQELLNQDVGILICNRIGPKPFAILNKAGVEIYSAAEGLNLETALKQYHAGQLPIIKAPNN